MPVITITSSAGFARRRLIAIPSLCTNGRWCLSTLMATGNMSASANVAPRPTTTALTWIQIETLEALIEASMARRLGALGDLPHHDQRRRPGRPGLAAGGEDDHGPARQPGRVARAHERLLDHLVDRARGQHRRRVDAPLERQLRHHARLVRERDDRARPPVLRARARRAAG